jgi:hypothetical protein
MTTVAERFRGFTVVVAENALSRVAPSPFTRGSLIEQIH